MKIISFGKTDPGRRSNNEDAYSIDDRVGLYLVADGIGGSEGGEVASRIVADALTGTMPDLVREQNVDADSALRQAVSIANSEVRRARDRSPELSHMGTTLSLLLIRKDVAYIANVGDSRTYLFRSGKLKQLTQDHSVVAEQIRAGMMTPAEANVSAYRHVITRALGIDDVVRPDIIQHQFQNGDQFLLCTDGLTEMVDDAEIARIMGAFAPQDAVLHLIDRANERGGADNITAVVVWIAEV